MGNSSVNTFPLLCSKILIMQQLDATIEELWFSTWSVPRCYKREVWSLVRIVSSALEAVNGELEYVKLKILHC
jgi:hypothetical protein